MSSIAVGIDPSTAKYMYPAIIERNDNDIAVCLGWDRIAPLLSVNQRAPDYPVQKRWFDFFRHVYDEHGEFAHVYVEDQHVQRADKTTLRLAQTAGWLSAAAAAAGLRADIIPSQTWRSKIFVKVNDVPRSLQAGGVKPKHVAVEFSKQITYVGCEKMPVSVKKDDGAESILIALAMLYPSGVHVL